MKSKKHVVLQDSEAMFQTRIADPKVTAEIERRDSTRPAAQAVMACFLGLSGKIASLEFAPKSEWRYGLLAGGCQSYSSGGDLEPIKACLKQGDITNARKHAARQIMYHMAAESARNRIESKPDENWMQGEAEVWFEWASMKPDSGPENWAGLDPATYASRTGAALRTANRVYPLPDYDDRCNSGDAYALYIEVCRLADEFFADTRVWEAVQRLAKELVRRGFINGDEMLDIVDDKDQTLAYLEEIASSKKWRDRIQPSVSPALPSDRKAWLRNHSRLEGEATLNTKPANTPPSRGTKSDPLSGEPRSPIFADQPPDESSHQEPECLLVQSTFVAGMPAAENKKNQQPTAKRRTVNKKKL